MSSRVEPLRRVRDQVLLRHPLGAAAVQLYYNAGPPLASAIKGNEAAAAAVRTVLALVVDLVEAPEVLLGRRAN
jgi:CBS-domain-containing membrane protein